MRPQTLKQHVAGIDVRGLFDLEKDHAVFALGDFRYVICEMRIDSRCVSTQCLFYNIYK